MSFLNELKRRNVLRVGAAYIVTAWLIIQVVETIFPLFSFGDSPARFIVLVLAVAFIPSLILAWVFEITPDGFKRDADVDRDKSNTRTTSKKFDHALLVMLVGYFAFDKFVLDPTRDADLVKLTTEEAQKSILSESYGENSIAVLPFTNMSDDSSHEYFSDGLSEELLNLLAKVKELRVTARTSSFSFKGKSDTVTEIARKLNVNYILEGSVRKSGNQIRITAQLIKADVDAHLWSETYTRNLDDVFVIQDEVARMVVDELNLRLNGGLPTRQPVDTQAYALFLQARHFANQYTEESLIKAEELYEQVLTLAPDYLPAMEGQVELYVNMFSLDTVEAIATDMLLIDSGNASAIAALGFAALMKGDIEKSAKLIRRAQNLDSQSLFVLQQASMLHDAIGKPNYKLNEYIVARDPVNALQHGQLGMVYVSAGKEYSDKAIKSFETALDLSPDLWAAHSAIGFLQLERGKYEKAQAEFEQEPGNVDKLIGFIGLYYAKGEQKNSDLYLQKLTDFLNDNLGGGDLSGIARASSMRQENDLAFKYLNRALENGDDSLVFILSERTFSGLHADPRWLPFLKKINRSPERMDAIELILNK